MASDGWQVTRKDKAPRQVTEQSKSEAARREFLKNAGITAAGIAGITALQSGAAQIDTLMRMGLLDDAIREHLDLKRARGGDPAEIERMEREALGPVRREPTIGSARFDAVEEAPPHAYDESEFHDEHPSDLEDLQELGYNDSTAPHAHPHHEHLHPHDEYAEEGLHFQEAPAEQLTPEPEEVEQPKRRFLRRNRPASLAEPAPMPDPGFHEEPPTEHHDLPEHPDALAHDEPGPPASPPPSLQFDHPPKRPRFTAEPPSLEPEPSEHPDAAEAPPEPRDAAPAPPTPEPPAPAHRAPEHEHLDEHAEQDEHAAPEPDAQQTTEFDVQKHMSDAPHEQDEDMLEETPDFLQDTPEHDRLWFEQRPPKDFDFNG